MTKECRSQEVRGKAGSSLADSPGQARLGNASATTAAAALPQGASDPPQRYPSRRLNWCRLTQSQGSAASQRLQPKTGMGSFPETLQASTLQPHYLRKPDGRSGRSCLPLTAYLVGRNWDRSDADRFEPVQPVQDLRFSARKYRGIEVRRDRALLSGAPTLDNSAVDANDTACARSSTERRAPIMAAGSRMSRGATSPSDPTSWKREPTCLQRAIRLPSTSAISSAMITGPSSDVRSPAVSLRSGETGIQCSPFTLAALGARSERLDQPARRFWTRLQNAGVMTH
jgi:hypothetical protein